jgi:hypothetical protein
VLVAVLFAVLVEAVEVLVVLLVVLVGTVPLMLEGLTTVVQD